MFRSGAQILSVACHIADGIGFHQETVVPVDRVDDLQVVASGQQLFRTAPPATPPKHLVVYFVPVDAAGRCLLLGDHRKSGLWLQPGGHVEDGEDPREAVVREADEDVPPAVIV